MIILSLQAEEGSHSCPITAAHSALELGTALCQGVSSCGSSTGVSQLPVGSSSQLGQVLVPLLKAIAVLGWPETSLSPLFCPSRAEGRVWYDTMEGQHNHPHHLGDQNNPLCKLPGQEFQHDPQVSVGV